MNSFTFKTSPFLLTILSASMRFILINLLEMSEGPGIINSSDWPSFPLVLKSFSKNTKVSPLGVSLLKKIDL